LNEQEVEMKAVLIRMTDEFHKKLRQRSVDTDKTVTAIVLESVEKALAGKGHKEEKSCGEIPAAKQGEGK
jgi:hypothetical protein